MSSTRSILRTPRQHQLVGNSLLIAGSARSGTTIAGKILGSMDRVEYLFEPPFLVSHYQAINQMPEETWKQLFEYYLYEDVLLDALSGRRINTNRHDDSSIYTLKTEDDIAARQSKSYGRVELEAMAEHHHLAVKLPEAVFCVGTLLNYYPEMRILLMHRDANDVLNSIVQKQWFSDESLAGDNPTQVYPTQCINNIKVPYWVEPSQTDWWVRASMLDRSAYYYLLITQSIADHGTDCLVLDYNILLQNPLQFVEHLTTRFKLQPGLKTAEILGTVSFQEKERTDQLSKVSTHLQTDIKEACQRVQDITTL